MVVLNAFDVGTIMLNSAMFGSIFLESMSMILTTKMTFMKSIMMIGSIFLLGSLGIDSASTILPVTSHPVILSKSYIDQLSTWLYIVSLTCIVSVLMVRTRAIHGIVGKKVITPVITYSLGPAYLLLRLTVNIYNSLIANAVIFNFPSPISPLNLQVFRTTMNVFAFLVCIYYETITSYYLFRHMDADKAAYKGQRAYSIFMSVLISLIFLVQAALQINRVNNPGAWAPFHSISWSLMMKRILDFREEYEKLRNSHGSASGMSFSGKFRTSISQKSYT